MMSKQIKQSNITTIRLQSLHCFRIKIKNKNSSKLHFFPRMVLGRREVLPLSKSATSHNPLRRLIYLHINVAIYVYQQRSRTPRPYYRGYSIQSTEPTLDGPNIHHLKYSTNITKQMKKYKDNTS